MEILNDPPPQVHHWFHQLSGGQADPHVWRPFSRGDSRRLEEAFTTGSPEVVPVCGGRYDVDIAAREWRVVYWPDHEPPSAVKRCSWFQVRPGSEDNEPFSEEDCELLEETFGRCVVSEEWPKSATLSSRNTVTMYSESKMFLEMRRESTFDVWGGPRVTSPQPTVVRRGFSEIEIEDDEDEEVDQLVFVVHGIGSFCDLQMRNIVECTTIFRQTAADITKQDFGRGVKDGRIHRVEFLPISWHSALHKKGGFDERIKPITLPSVPMLRTMSNDVILDVLLYQSPVFCQHILDTVADQLNRLYHLFVSRTPKFSGRVALVGHSLGSLICFDLLMHQPPPGSVSSGCVTDDEKKTEERLAEGNAPEQKAGLHKETVAYTMAAKGIGQPFVVYPKLAFAPVMFFTLGSPVAMFVTVRGMDVLGKDFRLPTCPRYFNIYHPLDPVAYRFECLIDPAFQNIRPFLIRHHKGRKRMHLVLKEQMNKLGGEMKKKLTSTLQDAYQMVRWAVHPSLRIGWLEELDDEDQIPLPVRRDSIYTGVGEFGKLNQGRRIDYMLQEKPYEALIQYAAAVPSHCCYWESEDTMAFMLKEIYALVGVDPDYIPGPMSDLSEEDEGEEDEGQTEEEEEEESDGNMG